MKKIQLSLIATILASTATLADTGIDTADHEIMLTLVEADADLLATYAKKDGVLAITDTEGVAVYDTEDIAAWTKNDAIFDAVLTKTGPLAATIFAKPETLMALKETTPGQFYLIKDLDGKIDVTQTSSIPNDPIELKIERKDDMLFVHVPVGLDAKMILTDGIIVSIHFEDKKFDDTTIGSAAMHEAHKTHKHEASTNATAEAWSPGNKMFFRWYIRFTYTILPNSTKNSFKAIKTTTQFEWWLFFY